VAGHVPAPGDRRTLYQRDVPDEAVRRLERLAGRDGVPVAPPTGAYDLLRSAVPKGEYGHGVP
jgi:hypothetical protein